MENPLHLEECIICFEETDNFMFFQCTHKVCNVCFPKLDRCPLCQPNHIKIQIDPIVRDDFKIWCIIIVILIFLVCFFQAQNLQV